MGGAAQALTTVQQLTWRRRGRGRRREGWHHHRRGRRNGHRRQQRERLHGCRLVARERDVQLAVVWQREGAPDGLCKLRVAVGSRAHLQVCGVHVV